MNYYDVASSADENLKLAIAKREDAVIFTASPTKAESMRLASLAAAKAVSSNAPLDQPTVNLGRNYLPKQQNSRKVVNTTYTNTV